MELVCYRYRTEGCSNKANPKWSKKHIHQESKNWIRNHRRADFIIRGLLITNCSFRGEWQRSYQWMSTRGSIYVVANSVAFLSCVVGGGVEVSIDLLLKINKTSQIHIRRGRLHICLCAIHTVVNRVDSRLFIDEAVLKVDAVVACRHEDEERISPPSNENKSMRPKWQPPFHPLLSQGSVTYISCSFPVRHTRPLIHANPLHSFNTA